MTIIPIFITFKNISAFRIVLKCFFQILLFKYTFSDCLLGIRSFFFFHLFIAINLLIARFLIILCLIFNNPLAELIVRKFIHKYSLKSCVSYRFSIFLQIEITSIDKHNFFAKLPPISHLKGVKYCQVSAFGGVGRASE